MVKKEILQNISILLAKNDGEVVLHSFKAGLAENMVPESATAVISGAKEFTS